MLRPQALQRGAHTILVVDDDSDSREALTVLLEDSGYTVISAADGREAFDRLRESLPAIIITDLMMPVMNGWEFLEQQSRDPDLFSIPVIVVTALPFPHPAGSKAILQKPIHFEDLVKVIEQNLTGT